MNAAECSALLAVMALYDNRKVADPDVVAWLKVIGDLPYADCERAVFAHYGSESTERIMPGHVRQRVRAMRSERLAREIMPAPPAGLTDNPGAYRAALRRRISEIADGMDIRLAIGGPLPGEPPPAWSEARKSLRAARAIQETTDTTTCAAHLLDYPAGGECGGCAADRKARPA